MLKSRAHAGLRAAPWPALREQPGRAWVANGGAVAQLGERRVRNAKVEGSIPFRSISTISKYL